MNPITHILFPQEMKYFQLWVAFNSIGAFEPFDGRFVK